MQIYNRWGSLLYETNNTNPGWDGTFNGDTCPDGVYFYIIDAIGFSTKKYDLHGTVTLLR
jgi:gliding motility-associated-like protein